jgi:PPOX class probable FMN-dependent enzyme
MDPIAAPFKEEAVAMDQQHLVTDVAALERLYGLPSGASVEKEVGYIHPHYRRMIEVSPFVVLATSGPGGLDTSPRGDPAGFVIVEDEKTLLIPDRRGNNRIDSLRNIIADPRVALLFLIPGVGETLRVNGRAAISTAPSLLERFEMDGKRPRSVIVVSVDTVFFQCSRAIWRSKLWDPETFIERKALPSLGRMIADLSESRIEAETYDNGLYERLKTSLY